MKNRVARAIGSQTPPKVIPPLNLVHCFVGNETLEDCGRCAPVNPLEDEETAVEPRAEQMHEIGIDARSFRMIVERAKEVRPHSNEQLCAAAGCIQPTKQFLAPRLRCGMKRIDSSG